MPDNFDLITKQDVADAVAKARDAVDLALECERELRLWTRRRIRRHLGE